jgi:hypothetical protein
VDSLHVSSVDTTVAGRNVWEVKKQDAGMTEEPTLMELVSVSGSDVLAAFGQTWKDTSDAVLSDSASVAAWLVPGSGSIQVSNLLDQEYPCGSFAYRPPRAARLTLDRGDAGRQTSDSGEGLPSTFALHAGAPNPSHGGTLIRFDLPGVSPLPVSVDIFDVAGRRVRHWSDTALPPGRHSRVWSGRNASGDLVASGVYFVRVTAGEFHATRKVVVAN